MNTVQSEQACISKTKMFEEYEGLTVEAVEWNGGTQNGSEMTLHFSEGKCLTLNCELDSSKYNIRPVLVTRRGSWGLVGGKS